MIEHDHTAVRVKTILVGVIDDRCSGALAYALNGALSESAKVRIVRISRAGTPGRVQLHLPIDTVELEGDPVDILTQESRCADLLVVEAPDDAAAAVTDPVLIRLRNTAQTLLVEVDRDGKVVRASGPQGWRYAETSTARPMPSVPLRPAPVIAVGVDASPAGRAAVRWARDMADSTGSRLRLVGVYGSEAGAGCRTEIDAARDVREAARAAHGVTVEKIVTPGEPADALIEASRDARMLVVGRHGTAGLIHSALGSVGDTCARMAECPVVIVPAD